MRLVLLICTALFIVAGLTACGEVRPLIKVNPLTLQLADLGFYFILAGGIATAVGVGLALAGRVGFVGGPFLGPIVALLSPFAPAFASFGIAGVALGCAFTWLSDNLWVLGASAVLTLVALGIHHRSDIRDWFLGCENTRAPTPLKG